MHIDAVGIAGCRQCRRSKKQSVSSAGGVTGRELIHSHGLAIMTHARMTPERWHGHGTAQRRPHARTHAARRIGSTSSPRRATGVKDKNPRRSNAAHASASLHARQGSRTLGPRPRIPQTAHRPPWVGRVARGLTRPGGRARRHVTPASSRAPPALPQSGAVGSDRD